MTPRSILKTLILLGGVGCAHAPPGALTGAPTQQPAPDLAPVLSEAFDAAALTMDPATGLALSASVLGCQVQYVPDVPHWPSPEHTLRLLGGN